MFLKRIPNDSKFIITFISLAFFVKYDSDVIIWRSKKFMNSEMQEKDYELWDEIIRDVV